MQKRRLGKTDLELSTIGLGTWAQGGSGWAYGWGAQDDRDSINTIVAAVEAGINWIDTAAVYGFGHAEEVVGRALRELPEKPLIATKCGRVPGTGERIVSGNLKTEHIQQECEDSLRRLGVDVIDLYQIHWPDPDPDIEEGWGAVADLVRAGKVRYAGVSNFNVAQLKRIQPIHPVASLQPPYSLFKRDIETEILPYCLEQQIGVLAYSPIQKGLLSGKMTRERIAGLSADDHRTRDALFQEPMISTLLAQAAELQKLADQLNISLLHLAIAWALSHPAMTSAIVGGRHPEQIRETAHAMQITLDEPTLQAMQKIVTPLAPQN